VALVNVVPSRAPKTASKTYGSHRARVIGLGLVFLWFSIGGVAHFAATRLEMRIVPPYIPWPRTAVLVSGLCELLAPPGSVQSYETGSRLGLFVLTIAVTPANFYMMQHADQFGVPYWALVLRLPVQVALLALIAWKYRNPRFGTARGLALLCTLRAKSGAALADAGIIDASANFAFA